MEQRAARAAATRERILDATMALHATQGVVATSHKDVAARADVSVGTVYHHFPNADELVAACGARTFELFPPPPLESIDGTAPLTVRIEQLTQALARLYAQLAGLDRVRLDRMKVPALDRGLRHFEEAIEALIRRALGGLARRKNAVAIVAAFTDYTVIDRLAAAGMHTREIANTLASILTSWLDRKDK